MARPFSATSRGYAPARPEQISRTVIPVEVMDVMLSESHPEFGKSRSVIIGAIKGRRYDTERGKSIENLNWFNPIDPSDLKIPLIGEAVLLIESPNQGIIVKPTSKDFCYIATVGILGAISNNAFPSPINTNESPTTFTGNMGPSSEAQIGDYAPNIFVSPLVAFEGDRIIQGRWGNAIRFSNTSNGSEDQTFWNGSGTDGDPIVIISNGLEETETFTRTEDLNDGSSNLILSSTQQIDIEASNKLPTEYAELNQYAGGQIILSSDKIVLNSMEDTVVISGKKGVSISTPEWKADFTEMMDILKDLLLEMKAQADGSSPFVTGAGPTGINAKSKTVLGSIETRLGNLEQ
tara:strand:+ start:215 stop:1261 length:1047 start_codon:yes stop_codon:yes gene_type:complete